MYFKLENEILNNLGQAYNFACLLGCSSIYRYEIGDLSKECLVAQLPNCKYIRYANFDDNSAFDVIEEFERRYDSCTNLPNAIAFLQFHLNLDVNYDDVFRIYCGERGVAVLFSYEKIMFSLELSASTIYKFDNL